MSGNYVKKLKERAMSALNIAKSTNYSNWKVFLAEQAAQLYIKAVYYELIGDRLRGHEIRGLIGQLALELEKNGFLEEAKKLRDFVVRNRDVLFFLEESYIDSRYGEEDFEDRFVGDAIKVAIDLIDLLEEVVKSVKLG
ncbi:HEPN domain-containing protein [Sulfurisphaera ohwakuensis]|uniref:HEPN domain-containing protein n=1 Tax=Sulfurisphaera ohwakuensis TaxID=69656 RepID=A0A650CI36_SULOH|nr:HEPN domain-containing protein [Sulfurisphaera ohwakuensis]MBB5254893.1 HEPN domain-containing protein [Sulfurisphaera ohwakuensis]QGR17480.1 HEPN domain-containing protein [Sulfurisphaera ohwakuensis]